MCRQPIIKPKTHYLNGQVILETAIVFVCLSVIAIASTRLFSNLNLNMLRRLQIYRDSRLNAVNNPASLAGRLVPTFPRRRAALSNPTTFLDYFPENRVTLSPESLGKVSSGTFYKEPRLNEAALLLEKQNLIMNLIGPYKLNQANYLASQLRCGEDAWGDAWISSEYYIPLIKQLVAEIINHRQGYNDFVKAIDLYTDVLNNPTVPGSYDPDVAGHAASYELDPLKDADRIQDLQTQHDQNRQGLQSTIDSLNSARPDLEKFSNMLINGSEGFFGLANVYVYIGKYMWGAGWTFHRLAVKTLADAVDFVGSIFPSVLSFGLASKINQVYSLLQSPVSYEVVSSAKTLSEAILADSQVQHNSELKSTVESLGKNLNDAIKHWADAAERDYYLGYAKEESWALSEVANITFALVSLQRR